MIKRLMKSDKEAARLAAGVMIALAAVLELAGSALVPANMENVENLVSLLSFAFVTLGGAEWIRSKVYSRDTVSEITKNDINMIDGTR